jgi:hypothetical protein
LRVSQPPKRNAFVHDGLKRQFFAAAHLAVGGDHSHSACVNDALLQSFGREAAEHHGMCRADTGTGLHGNHAFNAHGHVNQDAVALLNALRLERIGKLADLGEQFFESDLGHSAVIGFKDDGRLVLVGGADVAVQAVGAGVQFAVVKPLVERRIGFVECFGKWLGPS